MTKSFLSTDGGHFSSPETSPTDSLQNLLAGLAGKPAEAWLEQGRALASRGNLEAAEIVLRAAVQAHPTDAEVSLALAGVRWQARDHVGAQAVLQDLIARQPEHVAASFTLARVYAEQGRTQAAAMVVQALFGRFRQPAELIVQAGGMLAEWGCKEIAADICEREIAAGSTDPGLHVYAGMLQMQLGNFETSRSRYRAALDSDPATLKWGAAYGIASAGRYDDPQHPDRERFERLLEQPGLVDSARVSLLFALGKISDDLGEYAAAAGYFRQANAIQTSVTTWPRKNWRRLVEARLNATPLPPRTPADGECIPIFIVGAPRSGTTLVAELLARSAQVCNRGELEWLPRVAEQVARSGKPSQAMLDKAAEKYLAQLRRDDSDALWFVDKQPLNFMHVDLIRALFPQARIIHCRRNSRDTALSIWIQHFGASEYRFAYDFADIAALMQGCTRLMADARRKTAMPILEVRYEELVGAPDAVINDLASSLGLPAFSIEPKSAAAPSVIGTASVWQARQPVYTRSVGRWQSYAAFVLELLQFPDD